jgi:hypothetical protein
MMLEPAPRFRAQILFRPFSLKYTSCWHGRSLRMIEDWKLLEDVLIIVVRIHIMHKIGDPHGILL